MRLASLIAAAVFVPLSAPASAAEWIEYASTADRFTLNFPGEPAIETTTYTSEYGAELPARVYHAEDGPRRYSLTVVDYAPLERILTEKSEACPPGAETCSGTLATSGRGQWRSDLRGALVFASWRFMQRDVKVTHYTWGFVDLVEGHRLQMTSNTDQSRTFASVHMHENKLYLLEATAPSGMHGQEQFLQSLGWLDENGVGLRYTEVYSNADIFLSGHPAPPRVNRAGTNSQSGQGRIDAPPPR
jgi:hypothetical protein